MSGDAKNSEINSVAIYSRLTKNMSQIDWTIKMIHAPRVPTVGGQGYQMFQTTVSGENTPSKYGPIILTNNFADLFFEKAVIEVRRGTEIEPSTQTHQTTKIVQLYTTVKPEEALYKYQNLGGYEEKYDSTMGTQLHQVPITIGTNGAITATTGANYKEITETQFTGGNGANNDFACTSAGAAKLTKRFDNGQEL